MLGFVWITVKRVAVCQLEFRGNDRLACAMGRSVSVSVLPPAFQAFSYGRR